MKTNRDRNVGRRAERRAAKRLGLNLTPASGALSMKGDLGDRNRTVMVEVKSTEKDSLSLKFAWLRKLSREALEADRNAALLLQFVDARGEPRTFGSWVMIPEWLWDEIRGS